MKFRMLSVFVNDQAEAERFYVDKLGLQVKHDIPIGEDRWLTVISPDDPDGPELLLEPSGHPAVKPYRDALMNDGIPLIVITVNDCQAEYERLKDAGVKFTQPPADMGTVVTAVFDDTCGNLVQLAQFNG